jgi:hypothetical protein
MNVERQDYDTRKIITARIVTSLFPGFNALVFEEIFQDLFFSRG